MTKKLLFTIKASQGTTITKDFQVDLGAEFAITNE